MPDLSQGGKEGGLEAKMEGSSVTPWRVEELLPRV